MLVFDNGKVLGTIGGGTLEYVAINKAVEIAKKWWTFSLRNIPLKIIKHQNLVWHVVVV